MICCLTRTNLKYFQASTSRLVTIDIVVAVLVVVITVVFITDVVIVITIVPHKPTNLPCQCFLSFGFVLKSQKSPFFKYPGTVNGSPHNTD